MAGWMEMLRNSALGVVLCSVFSHRLFFPCQVQLARGAGAAPELVPQGNVGRSSALICAFRILNRNNKHHFEHLKFIVASVLFAMLTVRHGYRASCGRCEIQETS